MSTVRPGPSHLINLSTALGTFEHARYATPREEHGYCVDDVARVAVFIAREPESEPLWELARRSLRFLARSLNEGGWCRNRCSAQGVWHGPFTNDDCWGRLLWAAGTTVARSSDDESVALARDIFATAVGVRSPWPRAMAFGALGATDVLAIDPENAGARAFVTAAGECLDRPVQSVEWFWPESRLTYANAVLPEALLAVGEALGNGARSERALAQLRWLLSHEMIDGIVVPTPVGGLGPDDHHPRFDQQPIEVAALADACARAYEVTREDVFADGLTAAIAWFHGANSLSVPMFDAVTGGGYDGLTVSGPNQNQGAESTLAMLMTMQYASVVVGVSR